MKRLFWNSFLLDSSLWQCPKSTVWGAIEEDGVQSFDSDELERMFGEHSTRSHVSVCVSSFTVSQQRREKARIQVLDETRRRQVCVMLARLPPTDTTISAVETR